MKAHILVLAIVSLLALGGCSKKEEAAPKQESALVIGQENIAKAANEAILTGPVISGTLTAEREATVRAEIGGALLGVYAEEGQAVKKGALLTRIEDRTLTDMVVSAQSLVRSAQNALDVAQREEQRTARLVQGGALADRDLELARNAVSGAQAQLADARSRLISAQQQLAKATVRSPINGIVARRPVHAGDIVTPGTELFVVMDPSSLELQASVPSEELPNLKVGTSIDFAVRGSETEHFVGKIERISPAADPVTRQVSVFVNVPNTARRLVSGLFAEGRVATQRRDTLVVPVSAVNRTDTGAWVLRLRDGKTERVEVRLGVEDRRTERIEVVSGLAAGDVLLMGAAQQITPGTPVQIGQSQAQGQEKK